MDILVLAAAAAVVVQAPLSVVEAGWVPYLENLPRLALGGLLAGYLVERTRLPGLIGLPLAMLLGVEAIILEFTRVAPDGSTAERVEWLRRSLRYLGRDGGQRRRQQRPRGVRHGHEPRLPGCLA